MSSLFQGLATLAGGDGSSIPVGRPASFIALLKSSLILDRGVGNPTFTRADASTCATFTDFEGVVRTVLANESRFQGARRVENIILKPEAISAPNGWFLDAGGITAVQGATAPDGTATAWTITTVAAINGLYYPIGGVAVGDTIRNSVWVRRVTGTGTTKILNGGNDAKTTITLTSTWQRFAGNLATQVSGGTNFGVENLTSGDVLEIWHPQAEKVNGQANQAPSEYVSVGVLSTPYHGAGIDGVKYFETYNPLYVVNNIVYDSSVTSNNIGTGIGVAGLPGFGVGVCPSLPAGFTALTGYDYPHSGNYGNYQYSDGSIMVWIPAFYYKWGTGANGLAVNDIDIRYASYYASEAAANSDGYALHRAFYDGGIAKSGVFVDKYTNSLNGSVASSVDDGVVLSSAVRGSLSTAVFTSVTGGANTYGGAIAAAKARGTGFFCSSRFIFAALAMLAYAHARASTATTYCAWYHATNNFPKGCNNNALGDVQDAGIVYTNDGNGTYPTGKTGSATLFSRTTHNGQNSGVADLNGLVWEITPGLTSNGTNLYILKPSATMKNVTGSNTLATDLWGATGIAALYDDLGTSYETWQETGADRTVAYGSASQVFSASTSGNAWNWAGAGGMLAAGDGGTNPFGNDIFYDYKPNELCPLSGGDWGDSSNAGVWALRLDNVFTNSNPNVGFRSALYLVGGL